MNPSILIDWNEVVRSLDWTHAVAAALGSLSVTGIKVVAKALEVLTKLSDDPERDPAIIESRTNLARARAAEQALRAEIARRAQLANSQKPAAQIPAPERAPSVDHPPDTPAQPRKRPRVKRADEGNIDAALAAGPEHLRSWEALVDEAEVQVFLLEELYAQDPGSVLWDRDPEAN